MTAPTSHGKHRTAATFPRPRSHDYRPRPYPIDAADLEQTADAGVELACACADARCPAHPGATRCDADPCSWAHVSINPSVATPLCAGCCAHHAAEVCHVCSRTETEPYTPRAFSMLTGCARCGEMTCSRCGVDDGDRDGEDWRGSRVCKPCLTASAACALDAYGYDPLAAEEE